MWLEIFNFVDKEYQVVILAGIFGILGVLYTSNVNWRQEKYFKLQQISEEIIIALWKYGKLMDEVYINEVVDDIDYTKLELQDKYHDLIFSKIQVYFSEFGLTKVRDLSVQLSELIAEEYLERKKEQEEGNISESLKEVREKISLVSIEMKDLLIIGVKRYGRPWYKNFIYYWIEKYN